MSILHYAAIALVIAYVVIRPATRSTTTSSFRLAGTALAMIPPAVLFFLLQKEFISGLTSGAVKG